MPETLVASSLPNPLDPALLAEPADFYAQLRAEAPVSEIPGTGVHLVATWEAVADAVRRVDDFSSNLTGVLVRSARGEPTLFELRADSGEEIGTDALATADEPQHAPERRLVQPFFARRALRRLAPRIPAITDESLSPLLDRGRGEWMSEVASRLPARVLKGLLGLRGVAVDDLVNWAYRSTGLLDGTRPLDAMGPSFQAAAQLARFAGSEAEHALADLERGRSAPELVAAMARQFGADRAARILVVLIGAGVESTASLLGSAALRLARDPELQNVLRRDRSRIPAFVEEVLRLDSPFRGHYRHVRRATELAGRQLRPGNRLFLLWASANRDPAVFDQPDQLLLDRPGSRRHIAFGHGAHFCVGAHLARLEAVLCLGRLLDQTRDFAVPADGGWTWVPSFFVRRLERLDLELESA